MGTKKKKLCVHYSLSPPDFHYIKISSDIGPPFSFTVSLIVVEARVTSVDNVYKYNHCCGSMEGEVCNELFMHTCGYEWEPHSKWSPFDFEPHLRIFTNFTTARRAEAHVVCFCFEKFKMQLYNLYMM